MSRLHYRTGIAKIKGDERAAKARTLYELEATQPRQVADKVLTRMTGPSYGPPSAPGQAMFSLAGRHCDTNFEFHELARKEVMTAMLLRRPWPEVVSSPHSVGVTRPRKPAVGLWSRFLPLALSTISQCHATRKWLAGNVAYSLRESQIASGLPRMIVPIRMQPLSLVVMLRCTRLPPSPRPSPRNSIGVRADGARHSCSKSDQKPSRQFGEPSPAPA